MADRQSRYRAGLWGEGLAVFWLRVKGYSILQRRFKTPVGEIDIIARRGSRIIFVEVKFRQLLETAAFSITRAQKRRINKAVNYWLHGNVALNFETLSLDVILVAPWRVPQHIAAAFEESDFQAL